MANRLSHTGFCPVCGQPILHPTKMKDGVICRECTAKVRVLFPVHYERNPKPGYTDVCVDPLQGIPVDNYEETARKARAYRENLRAKHGGYNAVYIVDKADADKGASVTNVYGRILYGTFFREDTALLLHGDAKTKILLKCGKAVTGTIPIPITIDEIRDRKNRFLFAWQDNGTAQEGYPFHFAFDTALAVEAGDLIVK